MTNIAKIFTVAVTLVVGTGAISGIALASVDHTFYPDRLENPKLSLPSPGVGSGIPAPYRIGDRTNEPSVSLPSPGVGSGIPAPYRIGDRTNEPSVSLPSPGVGSGIPAPYRIGN